MGWSMKVFRLEETDPSQYDLVISLSQIDQEEAVRIMSGRLSVLLLDDEPIVGKRLRPALGKSGCDVEIFENSRQALQRIADKDFDIVVTDIRMDEIDGLQAKACLVRGQYFAF